MKKLRIGVMGAYRGSSMIRYCTFSEKAQVVAICDKWEQALQEQKAQLGEDGITYYSNFEDFLQHDMDAVVLANYANEHAPFTIRCLKKGLHVFSEVLPCQTMKEAVELIEAVEETGRVYAYGENYCYMSGPWEMRRLYRQGKLGEFEYGEGEYVHNCEPIWPYITYGEKEHWRNSMYSTFYCTHSFGPLVHITGLRPVSVIGIEGNRNERNLRTGSHSASFGEEIVTFENGGIAKSIHGGLYRNSIWYTVYGSKGRMETAREDAEAGDVKRLYVNCDEFSGQYADHTLADYEPQGYAPEVEKQFGHGGSDYYCIDQFVKKILGEPDADTIDVYEALDMFLPGLLGYRSILKGSVPVAIPNLRNRAERDVYRNDTACTDPKVAGDQLLPTTFYGTPDIPDAVYQNMKRIWETEGTESDYYKHSLGKVQK